MKDTLYIGTLLGMNEFLMIGLFSKAINKLPRNVAYLLAEP